MKNTMRCLLSLIVGLAFSAQLSAEAVAPIEPQMVSIPGGNFHMGDVADSGVEDAKPIKKLSLKPFLLARTETTWDEFQRCIDAGACEDNTEYGGDNGWGKGDRPVIEVNWDDAQSYIRWLNRTTGRNYRLPTEAEWEYAARAGTETEYVWGDEVKTGMANCYNCGSEWDNRQTAPVGSFPANAFGLHDMQGNVWEWVQDCYFEDYDDLPLDGSSVEDEDCSERVRRGGSWFFIRLALDSAYRSYVEPHERKNTTGFRLAMSAADAARNDSEAGSEKAAENAPE